HGLLRQRRHDEGPAPCSGKAKLSGDLLPWFLRCRGLSVGPCGKTWTDNAGRNRVIGPVLRAARQPLLVASVALTMVATSLVMSAALASAKPPVKPVVTEAQRPAR